MMFNLYKQYKNIIQCTTMISFVIVYIIIDQYIYNKYSQPLKLEYDIGNMVLSYRYSQPVSNDVKPMQLIQTSTRL